MTSNSTDQFTLFGNTSANTTNGNDIIPIDALKTTKHKLRIATQLSDDTSYPCLFKKEKHPIDAKPIDVPHADTSNKIFRPALSTNNVEQYVPMICIIATMMDARFEFILDPDSSKMVAVYVMMAKQPLS
jgi:hypothetical protein